MGRKLVKDDIKEKGFCVAILKLVTTKQKREQRSSLRSCHTNKSEGTNRNKT